MPSDYDGGIIPQYADFQMPTEMTVKAVAQLTASYIEYVGLREKWEARLSEIQENFRAHSMSELNTLEKRRIEAELTSVAIEAARNLGDSAAVVSLFKFFMDGSPDLISPIVEIIKSNKQS